MRQHRVRQQAPHEARRPVTCEECGLELSGGNANTPCHSPIEFMRESLADPKRMGPGYGTCAFTFEECRVLVREWDNLTKTAEKLQSDFVGGMAEQVIKQATFKLGERLALAEAESNRWKQLFHKARTMLLMDVCNTCGGQAQRKHRLKSPPPGALFDHELREKEYRACETCEGTGVNPDIVAFLKKEGFPPWSIEP